MGCSGGQEGSRVKGGPSRGCQGGGRGLLPAGWHRGQVRGRGGGPLNPLSITQCPESPLWLCPPWFISLLEPSLPQQPSSHEQDLGVQRCRGAGRPGGAPRGSNKLGGGAAGRFWGWGGSKEQNITRYPLGLLGWVILGEGLHPLGSSSGGVSWGGYPHGCTLQPFRMTFGVPPLSYLRRDGGCRGGGGQEPLAPGTCMGDPVVGGVGGTKRGRAPSPAWFEARSPSSAIRWGS